MTIPILTVNIHEICKSMPDLGPIPLHRLAIELGVVGDGLKEMLGLWARPFPE